MVVVTALLAAFLLIAGSDNRRLGRLGEDVAHLKEIGAATGQYGSDNGDLFWTFSWRAGQTYQSQYPDLNGAADDLQAAANQAVYILRTKAGRAEIPRMTGWIPQIGYSHLVLLDYLGMALPSRMMISSGDRNRLQWASDPLCFDAGCFPCQPGSGVGPFQRWPYSSSFSPSIPFIDRSAMGSRLSQQGANYNQYYVFGSSTVLAGANMTSVAFSSQKVLLSDQNARHFGARQPYCTHPEARLPLLMVDGGVPVRSAADSNLGWDPNSANVSYFSYLPSACWDPPALNPAGDTVAGRFRYTRQGLAGRDFGGPEVH